jgi:hypothetical protein
MLSLTCLLAGANAMTTESLHQELVAIDAPGNNIEKETIHFSHVISPKAALPLIAKSYESVSDEYWFEVTGKQLNQGIDLSVSHPGSLIRLSSSKVSNKLSPADLAIDPNDIELFRVGAKHDKSAKVATPFQQSVTQEQLATANIFPNSSAIKLNKEIGSGSFKLKVSKNLIENQSYIVNVKEKDSKYKLHLSTPSQSYSAGQLVSFEANIKHDNRDLTSENYTAFIKMPSGEKQAVNLRKEKGKYQIKVPETVNNGINSEKIGELYELHLESKALDAEIKVQRNGKFAFAITQPTARMTGKLVINKTAAMVDLDVASEGRYEVSGIIYGANNNGELTQIMLSRSAYYLLPGEQKVELRFDNAILRKSGIKPPYSIKGLKLMDQSRMALLQQL